jgi:hypothetical protein
MGTTSAEGLFKNVVQGPDRNLGEPGEGVQRPIHSFAPREEGYNAYYVSSKSPEERPITDTDLPNCPELLRERTPHFQIVRSYAKALMPQAADEEKWVHKNLGEFRAERGNNLSLVISWQRSGRLRKFISA